MGPSTMPASGLLCENIGLILVVTHSKNLIKAALEELTVPFSKVYVGDSNISFEKVDELNESTGKSEKKYKIKGIFSTIGEKNRNGRIYPPEI